MTNEVDELINLRLRVDDGLHRTRGPLRAETIEREFQGREFLADLIVQLASNAAALSLLNIDEAAGKLFKVSAGTFHLLE